MSCLRLAEMHMVAFAPGQQVVIQGVKAQPQLNGQKAIVKEKSAEDRWVITLEGTGERKSLKESCLCLDGFQPHIREARCQHQQNQSAPTPCRAAAAATADAQMAGRSSGFAGMFRHLWQKGTQHLWSSRPAHNPFKLLLLGQTGSGKTSFLNLVCNTGLILQLSDESALDQLRDFNDIKLENNSQEKMVSKTDAATLYNIDLCGLPLGIIDTPGFGDTRGLEVDKKHTTKIVNTIKQQEYISCICLVINGRESRMNTSLKHVLSEIAAILPRSAIDNLIVVFTNTSSVLDLNFAATELQQFLGKAPSNVYFIENPYVKLQRAKQLQDKVQRQLIQDSLKRAFNDTAEELIKMQHVMAKLKNVHTNDFNKVYTLRQQIELSTNQTLNEFSAAQDMVNNLELTKKRIKAARHEADLAANFKKSYNGHKWVLKQAERHVTLCGAPNCHSNCHKPCIMEKTLDSEKFKGCTAFYYTRKEAVVNSQSDLGCILAHMSNELAHFHTNQDGGEGTNSDNILVAATDFDFQGHCVAKGASVSVPGFNGEQSGFASRDSLCRAGFPVSVTFYDTSDQDTCKECGHDRKFHYHDEKMWVQEPYVEEMVDYDLKAQYDAATGLEAKQTKALEALEVSIKKKQEEMQKLQVKLFENILQFEQHASRATMPYSFKTKRISLKSTSQRMLLRTMIP